MQERGVTLRDGDALTCTSRHDAEKLPTLRSGIKSKERYTDEKKGADSQRVYSDRIRRARSGRRCSASCAYDVGKSQCLGPERGNLCAQSLTPPGLGPLN